MSDKVQFPNIDYSSIKEIRTMESTNKVVKFGGYIGSLEDPIFKKRLNGDSKLTSTVTFKDEKGRQISSLPISASRFQALEKRMDVGEPIEVIGRVVKTMVEKKKKNEADRYTNEIEIVRTRSGDMPLRLLQVSKSEITAVKQFINDIERKIKKGTNWALFEALKETIIEEFRIVGIDKSPIYSHTLDTMITQAFSGGTVGNSNGKIHVCVIGPPSAGKKLLFGAANLLNIVTQEAQSGSVSQAGLTGSCKLKNGEWVVEKGLIPLAHRGVFGMQDFDKSQLKPTLFEILGPVMEDGKCVISKAGKETFFAETGIYLDLNKQSDLLLDESIARNVVEDTGLPTYIISRFDYICVLPKDTKRQFQNAIESINLARGQNRKRKDTIYKFCRSHGLSINRFLKLITAYLMEQYDQIETEPVKPLILKKYKAFINTNRNNFDLLKNAGMFQMRLKNSIFKFVEALTRIQLLNESNEAAVEKTFQLLSQKLNFLKNIDPALLVPSYQTTTEEILGRWLGDTYGNNRFAPKKAFGKYEKDGSPAAAIKERQFRNLLIKVAIKKEHGVWIVKSKFLHRS